MLAPHAAGTARRLKRRSALVAFLDVAGYSRLMGANGTRTFRRWVALQRGLVEPRIASQGGRVVDRAGDGLLVEFRRPGEALAWAVDLQAEGGGIASRSPPIRFRIALHEGEAIDSLDGGLHGDCVNVAARLQALAEPGGVIASESFVSALGGAPAGFVDLGELHLKNIERPVRAFALPAAVRGRKAPAAAGARPDPRPSIAVLPFRSDAQGRDEAYFADGIAEGVIHVLAGLEGLFVISRGSTLGYAGRAVDPRVASRELGVRYVLQGSVRRAGQRLRITTELCDGESGAVVRAHRHEGAAADLFDLQDRISAEVAATLIPRLQERELERAMRKHPESMTAYDLVLQAIDLLYRLDRGSFGKARTLLQQAIADDPGYAPAYSHAATWHNFRIGQGWSPSIRDDHAEAARCALAALERDRNDATALAIHGQVLSFTRREYGSALHFLDRALSVGPSCFLAWTLSSTTRGWVGDGPAAVEHARKALRLSPLDPFAFFAEHMLSQGHYVSGEYREAVEWGRRSAARNGMLTSNLRTLAASLVAAGDVEAARGVARRVLELEPSFRLARFAERSPMHPEILRDHIPRLRAAGLPD